MGRIIIGIILAAVGVAVIVQTEWVVQNFGTNSWAEQHLGTEGGSRLFYKLIGLIIIFVGFLLVTNMFEGFVMATIGKLFIIK